MYLVKYLCISIETLRPKKIGHKEKNATGVKINTAEKP